MGFAPPSEEGEDGPEGATMIGLVAEVGLGHLADSFGMENASGCNQGGLGELFGPAP